MSKLHFERNLCQINSFTVTVRKKTNKKLFCDQLFLLKPSPTGGKRQICYTSSRLKQDFCKILKQNWKQDLTTSTVLASSIGIKHK